MALEARLRDEITAPALLAEAPNASVSAARRRGVDVLLAPPSGPQHGEEAGRIAEWFAARFDGAVPRAFVGRITRTGSRIRPSAHTALRDEALELQG